MLRKVEGSASLRIFGNGLHYEQAYWPKYNLFQSSYRPSILDYVRHLEIIFAYVAISKIRFRLLNRLLMAPQWLPWSHLLSQKVQYSYKGLILGPHYGLKVNTIT